MSIKTGNGGFEIDGKSLTFDVDDIDSPGIDPVGIDHGDVNVDDSKKDISKKTKETLGRYVGSATSINRYPVDAQSKELTLTTNSGVPASLTNEGNGSKFVDRSAIDLPHDIGTQQRNGDRLSNKIDDPSKKLAISKGKTTPQLPNGNDVLPSIVGGSVELPKSIKGYVSAVLSNNRFTDASRSDSDSLVHPKYGDVSMGRLSQVGVALSLRGSQESGASNDGNNPSSGGQEAKALLPSYNQLGAQRINTTLLQAKDVLDSLTKSEVPEYTSIAPQGSWGVLNNVDDPYSGITSIGMIALSAALTAAVVVLFEGLGFILSLIKGGDKTGAAKNADGRYALGRYTLTQGPDPNAFPPTSFPPDIGAMLGIRPTIHPFSAALQVGVTSFFGINTDDGILGSITSGLESATENPGYNSIVARSIIRSTLTIVDSFKHAFKSSNLISGVKNVLSIVEAIRSSKLISAMNVFASLGDQVMVENELDETVKGLPGEPKKISRIDKFDDSAGAVKKNRLRGNSEVGTLKLAWSSNRSPSSYLIPDPLITLSVVGSRLGAFQTLPGIQSPMAKNYFKILSLTEQVKTSLRIPYDSADPKEITVKGMEGLLEAEYMPFYFHDLRTNEIISFHAFITQLTDDFTANWEQTDAYGRVDPIKVYKSTTRRISVGFYVISTSDEDFNDMWVKINKLVTLVYPQYTQGRLLSDAENNNQFIQPFSQLIGASPLVRLRLGDLFRSNYSRFALARLFGADSNIMKLNGTNLKFENGIAGFQKLQSSLASDLKNPTESNAKFLLMTNNMAKPSEAGGVSVNVSLPSIPGTKSGSNTKIANSFSVPAGDVSFFVFGVKKDLGDGRVIVQPEIMSVQLLQDFFGISSPAASKLVQHLKAEYDNDKNVAKRVVGGEYVVSKSDLRVSPDRLSTLMQKAFGTATVESATLLADFMNPENNALVKSFKQTQGKGLAGTIDSLNFDFYNQVTWETAPGKRAPQFCRVNLSFSPIHDVSPGLDANGFNRAPVYPIGGLAHGSDNTKEGS